MKLELAAKLLYILREYYPPEWTSDWLERTWGRRPKTLSQEICQLTKSNAQLVRNTEYYILSGLWFWKLILQMCMNWVTNLALGKFDTGVLDDVVTHS